ncbi:MAG: hypothetical protein FWF84_02395 [Kiritimatiellaeota bacterium]|nr:hypothetical protein [Kiritimatiellota bacterium]
MAKNFVGFGFGPIQAALFAKLAAASGRFDAITVGDVDGVLVEALQRHGGNYAVNVAYPDGIKVETVRGVRLLNLTKAEEAAQFREALGRATEIATSLPSVAFYANGGRTSSCAALLREALQQCENAPCIVYTAENNNHAAEILETAVNDVGAHLCVRPVQYLNTVIGKMSQVIADPDEIARRALAPMVPGFPRAFLVESFNRILISRITLPGFTPGITAFEEKDDLLPFEEAKLFGHNAIHAVMGFLCKDAGLATLSALRDAPALFDVARKAFLEEVGVALVRKYAATRDPLFTPHGMTAYANDLLERMTNPHLADSADRAVRDPLRKLAANDRLFGAMRLCLAHDVTPRALAFAARAALRTLALGIEDVDATLAALWGDTLPPDERRRIAALLSASKG